MSAPPSLAQALFAPRSVALVGASSDAAKNTARPQRFLQRHGYRGKVFPINPGRDEVQGVRAYASVTDVPEPVDHALVMVPASKVLSAVEACGEAGVPVVTIYSDGFADLGTDEGMRRQQALVARARALGVRLIGPNSMGVMNFATGLTLSVNAILEIPTIARGGLGVVSQSGTMLGSLLSRGQARGFGFSKMVSVGNECDLGVGEILSLLVDDADTRAVLLFLESLRGAQELAAAARRAHEAAKPVIAFKLGRSDLGRQLAATHSGAMTGDSAVADAFFRAHGIVRVGMLETLLEIAPLLACGPGERAARVAVMTTTGGGAATVVDRLGELGIETVPASAAVAGMLQAHGIQVAGKAIVDLTMAGARREVFEAALAGILEDDTAAAVVVVVGSSGQFHPQLTVEPIVAVRRVDKPLAVFILPEAQASLALLAEAGIAAFRTPESCAEAVKALLDWRCPAAGEAPPSVGLERVTRLLQAGRNSGFDEAEAASVLDALGIPVAPFRVITDRDAPVDLEPPFAVKLLSRRITHKTELGAVVLDVAERGGVADAVAAIERAIEGGVAGETGRRFLLQRMQRGIGEAMVGYRLDPEVGPLISVGVGGRLTEVYRDLSVRLAPVDLPTAKAMIGEVKGFAALRGFRGLPAGDLEALAEAVVALSRLALIDAPRVSEAEINPLLVRASSRGVVAVDAVLVLAADGP